jgi:hypothetical protein
MILRFVVRTFALTIALTMVSTVAAADPIPLAELRYVETLLDDGAFQYDYTLFNLTDSSNPENAGVDAYDFLIAHEFATFTIVSLPVGWDGIAGFQSARAFSIFPGPPPAGGDVAPGTSLAGFRFTTDSRVGDLQFEVTLTNPFDADAPFVVRGTSSPLVTVPEPATLWLVGAGVIGGLVFRRVLQTSAFHL